MLQHQPIGSGQGTVEILLHHDPFFREKLYIHLPVDVLHQQRRVYIFDADVVIDPLLAPVSKLYDYFK